MKNWLVVASLGVVAGLGTSAVADDDHGAHNRGQRVFRAQLTGLNEVPSVSTAARGQFYATVNRDETEIRYWLSFSNLGAPVSMAHIHFGQHHVNGGIIVWLCEGTLPAPTDNTPSCGVTPTTSTAGPVTGVIKSTEVIGPADRGIESGEFAALLAAMRGGAAYANVHSASPPPPATPILAFPGGEIRGQIQ